MNFDNIQHDVATVGYHIEPNLISGDLLTNLSVSAATAAPARGRIKGKGRAAINETTNVPYTSDLEPWDHYWTEQMIGNPDAYQYINIVSPMFDCLIDDWTVWRMDHHILNPGSTKINVHMDIPYMYAPWHNDFNLVGLQCILTLDDFTEENGATCYLPGSHNNPLTETYAPRNQMVNDYVIEHGKRLIAPAGSVIVYNGRMLHTMMPNNSDKPRKALLLNIVSKSILPELRLYDSLGGMVI
jgi:ectoine hydroxylase-related dioxygenase (phytanoyl-CoA dioxygenase family)